MLGSTDVNLKKRKLRFREERDSVQNEFKTNHLVINHLIECHQSNCLEIKFDLEKTKK